ncbi:ribbon-helix-helix protein, CopG family [Candidatus Woesearchaeota archaeon]|nr:ribbon-helix-helix protein, CopG family [Candidatus Woesearchaeota archaeon]MBU3941586.1 ribbon-helix-helix domain-containing protein [Nanoarchaeota archaeon]
METVTFKLQEGIVKKIDRMIRPLNFNNRTEFIREAIREKLILIERDSVIHELRRFKGTSKLSVSDKKLHEIREEVANKYAKNLGIKLD